MAKWGNEDIIQEPTRLIDENKSIDMICEHTYVCNIMQYSNIQNTMYNYHIGTGHESNETHDT